MLFLSLSIYLFLCRFLAIIIVLLLGNSYVGSDAVVVAVAVSSRRGKMDEPLFVSNLFKEIIEVVVAISRVCHCCRCRFLGRIYISTVCMYVSSCSCL